MFTILNDADAAYTVTVGGKTFAPQAVPDRVDVDILVAGQAQTGVIRGCAITAQPTPDGTVAVEAGTVSVGLLTKSVVAGTLGIVTGTGSTPAHATLPRFTLVVADANGVVSAVAGNAAGAPKFPALPANSVALAAVYIPPTDTTIDPDQIVDKRVAVLTVSRDRLWARGSSPDALDDEFNDDSIASVWTQVNVNANAVTWRERGDILSGQLFGAADAGGTAAHALMRPLDGASFPITLEGAFRYFRPYATNYQMWGPIFSDGLLTTSKVVWCMPYGHTGIATAWDINLRSGTFASIGTAVGMGNREAPGAPALHLRLQWRAANTFRCAAGPDGVLFEETSDLAYTMTPTHFGVAMGSWGGAVKSIGSVEHLRVYRTLTPD